MKMYSRRRMLCPFLLLAVVLLLRDCRATTCADGSCEAASQAELRSSESADATVNPTGEGTGVEGELDSQELPLIIVEYTKVHAEVVRAWEQMMDSTGVRSKVVKVRTNEDDARFFSSGIGTAHWKRVKHLSHMEVEDVSQFSAVVITTLFGQTRRHDPASRGTIARHHLMSEYQELREQERKAKEMPGEEEWEIIQDRNRDEVDAFLRTGEFEDLYVVERYIFERVLEHRPVLGVLHRGCEVYGDAIVQLMKRYPKLSIAPFSGGCDAYKRKLQEHGIDDRRMMCHFPCYVLPEEIQLPDVNCRSKSVVSAGGVSPERKNFKRLIQYMTENGSSFEITIAGFHTKMSDMVLGQLRDAGVRSRVSTAFNLPEEDYLKKIASHRFILMILTDMYRGSTISGTFEISLTTGVPMIADRTWEEKFRQIGIENAVHYADTSEELERILHMSDEEYERAVTEVIHVREEIIARNNEAWMQWFRDNVV